MFPQMETCLCFLFRLWFHLPMLATSVSAGSCLFFLLIWSQLQYMLVKIAKVQLSFAELIVDIWQLPTEAHQGEKGVCRPSNPHPPQQLIPSPLSLPTSHHKLPSYFFFFFFLPSPSQLPSRPCRNAQSHPKPAACSLHPSSKVWGSPSPAPIQFIICIALRDQQHVLGQCSLLLYLVACCRGALVCLTVYK